MINVGCGADGRMYPAMCGAADDRIGILEVPEAKKCAKVQRGHGRFNLSIDGKNEKLGARSLR